MFLRPSSNDETLHDDKKPNKHYFWATKNDIGLLVDAQDQWSEQTIKTMGNAVGWSVEQQ